MLNIGYIGNGKSTNRYHIPFVLQRNNLQIKTIYARNLEKTDWARIESVKYTSNLNDLLQDKDINLIVVCTMQDSHFEYAKMALESNKNVLIEKPFMMTYNEAIEIFNLAKEKGLVVQCYQNRRYDSDFLTAQKVIESGKLGDVYELEMHFDYYRPETPLLTNDFNPYNGFLYGHGCHTIDQVISYFGKPAKINYDVRALLGEGRYNDYFDLDLFYNNLKVSIKSSYFRIKPRPSFVLYGTKGMFIKESKDRQEEHLKKFYMPHNFDFGRDLKEHYGTLTYVNSKGETIEGKVPSEVGDYGRVYDDIYNTIVNKKDKIIKDEETLLLMKILEEGINSL